MWCFFLIKKGLRRAGCRLVKKNGSACAVQNAGHTRGQRGCGRGSATAVCWVDQEKVCAEEKKCFWISVLEMYAPERHIHK